uniref:NADH-ubiquinone oxidoreductase chain 4L n=1 Tax=Neotrogla sp. 5 KY-2017 TaxID=2051645 RepID=A0A343QCB8_9NEOP|nr:NADH dehydrogenase subunit 4L [Neotrogla sp. 5 KY-2017]
MLKEVILCLGLIMFISGLYSFVYNLKHLLCMLISLEFMSMSLFIFIYFYLSLLMVNKYFLMVYLTFAVCEGALGVCLLISMIRSHGNDYLENLSLMKC